MSLRLISKADVGCKVIVLTCSLEEVPEVLDNSCISSFTAYESFFSPVFLVFLLEDFSVDDSLVHFFCASLGSYSTRVNTSDIVSDKGQVGHIL